MPSAFPIPRWRLLVGAALITGAAGIFIDAAIGDPNGSWGLIPAYFGGVPGMIGLVFVLYKDLGRVAGVLSGLGIAGVVTFWGSYPDYATLAGLGMILVGIVLLSLPMPWRLASPVWVSAGVLGITPELVLPGRTWGPISSFALTGAALAISGAYVLWGKPTGVEMAVEMVRDQLDVH